MSLREHVSERTCPWESVSLREHAPERTCPWENMSLVWHVTSFLTKDILSGTNRGWPLNWWWIFNVDGISNSMGSVTGFSHIGESFRYILGPEIVYDTTHGIKKPQNFMVITVDHTKYIDQTWKKELNLKNSRDNIPKNDHGAISPPWVGLLAPTG